IGYKASLHSAMVVGLFLSAFILLIVRNKPKYLSDQTAREMQSPINMNQLTNALYVIFTNKQMWLIGIIGCLLYLPSSIFLDLWGCSYLKAVYRVPSEPAVTILCSTLCAWLRLCP